VSEEVKIANELLNIQQQIKALEERKAELIDKLFRMTSNA
jgi:hypothetical protein